MVLFDNISIGVALGLSIGLAVGSVIGAQKDKEVNKQMEEKGYIIKRIEQNIENKSFSVTIVTKQGEESVVSVPEGQMQTEEFSIGDIVFLDDDGMLEQAFDKED